MLIRYSGMSHPARMCERIDSLLRCGDAHAKRLVAGMCGYDSWADLEAAVANRLIRPSLSNAEVSQSIRATRERVLVSQLMRTMRTLGIEPDSAYDLYEILDPCGGITTPNPASSTLIPAFPAHWRITAAEYEQRWMRLAVPSDFACDVRKDGIEVAPWIVRRTLTASCASWAPPGHPDQQPVVHLEMRISLSVTDGVVTEAEVFLEETSTTSSFVGRSEAALVAECLCAYLAAGPLWATGNTEWCGAVGGVHFDVIGHVACPGVGRIAEALADRLQSMADMGFGQVHPGELALASAYEGELPVRSVACSLEYASEEDEEVVLSELQEDGLLSEIDAVTLAMREAPMRLEQHLQRSGFGQYAEMALQKSIDTNDGLRQFIAFVASMEKAKAISAEVSLYFRHFFADARASVRRAHRRLSGELEPFLDEERLLADLLEAARDHGDKALAKLYQTRGIEAVVQASDKGLIELYGLGH